jgi:benzoate 4-monooxygenase
MLKPPFPSLAYFQMQLALATTLLRYEFTLQPGAQLRSIEGFMHKPVELWVHVRRRGQKAA